MLTPEQRLELRRLIRESEHAALNFGIKGAQNGSVPEHAREARRDAWRALDSYLDSITDYSTVLERVRKDG